MAKLWPNGITTYPFSGIQSGYVIHPYHISDLYDELSGVESSIGLNPLNGFSSLTARITGIESGYWNISQDSVRAPLVILNNGGVSILSGKFAGALESGFLSAVDWTSFNSRVFRAGDTMTGALYGPSFSGVYITGLNVYADALSVNQAINFVQNGEVRADFGAMDVLGLLDLSLQTTSGNIYLRSLVGDILTEGSIFPTVSGTDSLGTQDLPYSGLYVKRIVESGIRPVGFLINAGGTSVIGSKSDNIYTLKGLTAGSGIVLNASATEITIHATGTGGISFITNAPLVLNNGVLSGKFASSSESGFLSMLDWNTFNSKQAALTAVSPLSIVGGTLSGKFATASDSGFLSTTDWNTFNNKQGALTLPGSVTLNGMTTWGASNTTFLNNSGIRTDGALSLTVGGTISGVTSGTQNIGASGIPFGTIYSNQYATSLLSGNPASAGSTYTINWNLGSSQTINFNPAISGIVSITLTNGIPGSAYTLKTVQNPSGTTNLAWGSNVKWSAGLSGVMTQIANSVDIFTFWNDGINYYGNAGYDYK